MGGVTFIADKEGYWTKNKTQTSKQELSRARHAQSILHVHVAWKVNSGNLHAYDICISFLFLYTDSLGGGALICGKLVELEWFKWNIFKLDRSGWKTDHEMIGNLNEP